MNRKLEYWVMNKWQTWTWNLNTEWYEEKKPFEFFILIEHLKVVIWSGWKNESKMIIWAYIIIFTSLCLIIFQGVKLFKAWHCTQCCVTGSTEETRELPLPGSSRAVKAHSTVPSCAVPLSSCLWDLWGKMARFETERSVQWWSAASGGIPWSVVVLQKLPDKVLPERLRTDDLASDLLVNNVCIMNGTVNQVKEDLLVPFHSFSSALHKAVSHVEPVYCSHVFIIVQDTRGLHFVFSSVKVNLSRIRHRCTADCGQDMDIALIMPLHCQEGPSTLHLYFIFFHLFSELWHSFPLCPHSATGSCSVFHQVKEQGGTTIPIICKQSVSFFKVGLQHIYHHRARYTQAINVYNVCCRASIYHEVLNIASQHITQYEKLYPKSVPFGWYVLTKCKPTLPQQ